MTKEFVNKTLIPLFENAGVHFDDIEYYNGYGAHLYLQLFPFIIHSIVKNHILIITSEVL